MKTARIPGKGGAECEKGEFSLVRMGALGLMVSEKLETAFRYEEILQMEQGNGFMHEISM